MNNSRRKLLKGIASISAGAPFLTLLANADSPTEQITAKGNFHFIYHNENHKKAFLNFLVNVFHLYPEQEFHHLIEVITRQKVFDEQIYIEVQNKLGEISSVLAPLTYSIPALNKQKKLIARQTQTLLKDKTQFSGYLEIGSTGRYLDALEESFTLDENRYFITDNQATFSPTDMIDRGQISKAGTDILLNNYQPAINTIPRASIDLVTVYIGFHHCPVHLRKAFITNIRDVMSDGGYLVVRDHNVINQKMKHTVALAHDVFNMGTSESWQYNNAELRNFYSLAELDLLLTEMGFTSDNKKLYQQGDPTLNALMLYRKV